MHRIRCVYLLLPSLVAMAWLVSKAQWFWRTNPDLEFGWILLGLICYMFWDACENLPPKNVDIRWWAAIAVVSGAILLFVFQVYQAAFGNSPAALSGLAIGILLFSFGNVGCAFGWPGVLRFAVPYGFILISLPMPSAVHVVVVNGLQAKVALVNAELLNILGVPAQQVGSLIHLPSGTVGVDEACSGIRSLQSAVMSTVFIGYITLKQPSLQVVLFITGVAFAILGNVLRSIYLSLHVVLKGVDSMREFHDTAGWSILLFTSIGVIIVARRMKRLEREWFEPKILPSEATPLRGGRIRERRRCSRLNT